MHQKLTEALLTKKESDELGGVAGWAELQDPFFGGDAAASFMDLPAHFKQHLAMQEQQQQEATKQQAANDGKQVFECTFNWSQVANVVHIQITVPPGITERDVQLTITDTKLSLGIQGSAPFINEAFTHKVKAQGSSWHLKDGTLHINCLKSNPGVAWPTAIASHTE